MLASDQKNKTFLQNSSLKINWLWPKIQNLTKFFAKNKSVESTVHETGLPDAASREVSMENTDEGSKAKSVNFKMSGSQSFRGSCMISFTTLCIVIFPERQARIFTLY